MSTDVDSWTVVLVAPDGSQQHIGTVANLMAKLDSGELRFEGDPRQAPPERTTLVIEAGPSRLGEELKAQFELLRSHEDVARWDVKKMSRGEKRWLKRQRGW